MENKHLNLAVEYIKQGNLVVMPTETVYGLAAPINDEIMLAKIFSQKERPFFDPLIVHVSDVEQAKACVAHWPEQANKLAQKFWPGPLTMVLEKDKSKVSDLITSGLDTVGLRCPDHALALEFINTLGVPVAAPSANKFTKVSPTRAEDVSGIFENTFVMDGGPCRVGIESTIVAITAEDIQILRPGHITQKDLQQVLGTEVLLSNSKKLKSPGSHHIHYRPEFELRLISKSQSQALELEPQVELRYLNTDSTLAARELYSLLRQPLKEGKQFCYFVLPDRPDQDKWQGILNRLERAATSDLRHQ